MTAQWRTVVGHGSKLDLWQIEMSKGGCKQSVGSAGMACEGRARNRMLRKRWIVRNPVVGEDDVTQFVLARPLGTSCSFCARINAIKRLLV